MFVLCCPQTDGISELLSQHYPDRPRKQLFSVEQVSMDAVGLRRLVVSQGKQRRARSRGASLLSPGGASLLSPGGASLLSPGGASLLSPGVLHFYHFHRPSDIMFQN